MDIGYYVLLTLAAVSSVYVKDTKTHFKIFVVGCLLFEGANLIAIECQARNTFVIINLYLVFQVAFFLFEFMRFNTNRSQRSWIIGLYVISSLVNYFWIQGPFTVNSYTYNPGMALVLVLIIRYLYLLLFKTNETSLLRHPTFWLGAGVFLFYSTNFPMLLFFDTIINLKSDRYDSLWDFIMIGNYFLALSYLFYIWIPWMKKT